MAIFEETAQDERTESPSQFRREEFRRQGTVAQSKELLSVVLLLSVGGTLYVSTSIISQQFGSLSRIFFDFSQIRNMTETQWLDYRAPLTTSFLWMVLPVFVIAMIAIIVASAAQVGFFVTTEPLSPNWERINPVAGFGRLFSTNGGVEALKAILKIILIGLIMWFFVRKQIDTAVLIYQRGVTEQISIILEVMSKLFFTSLSILAGLAGIDYAYQRFQVEKQMRTTRREAKEEFKLREGDPLIKSRIRNIQRRLASKRMMEDVPKADVVVTNPTHLAVALKYDSKLMSAPKIMAKGAGEIAQKIRELARQHAVPIVENKPLARTLYKELEVGQMIPKELYKAVAEVLAYVYRLKMAVS